MSAKLLGPVDLKLLLQAAVTKVASFNGAALDMGDGFDVEGVAGLPVQVAVPIAAADFVSGNESYKFEIEDSPDNATFTKRSAAVSALAGDVGSPIVVDAIIHARYVRLVVTIAGTTPTVTYGDAYLYPRRVH